MKCTKCKREIRHNWFPKTFCWGCDTTSRMSQYGSMLRNLERDEELRIREEE
tara:strand:- start:556 stop:711 length:156 start_codon:yes stop_codon:yes gene_type:complete